MKEMRKYLILSLESLEDKRNPIIKFYQNIHKIPILLFLLEIQVKNPRQVEYSNDSEGDKLPLRNEILI